MIEADKIDHILNLYDQLKQQLVDEGTTLDHTEYARISKEMSRRQSAYDLATEYRQAKQQLAEATAILDSETDEAMIELAKEQLNTSKDNMTTLEEKLTVELLPKDPNDEKNIFLEIRPAAGGDESALFAAELMRAYMLYAQSLERKPEIVEQSDNDIGGIKFAVIRICGDSVYSRMKFESGVHRVQRIPSTESQGRVHTSTLTVAVMPEADEVDVQIDDNDITMDTFAASSAGGQNANKNQTGVRLHHNPTGIIVTIADSKSQLQNKEKAHQILRSKIYQAELDKKQAEEQDLRGGQIGSGDRSEKIRTYNYPQDRVTDHRIKQSRSNIPGIMSGDMHAITEALMIEEQTSMMQAMTKA
jgi:peptide chain release factor 1